MTANIRELAQGKGRYVLESMGFPSDFMGKKHSPCPMCGGKDRYRFTDYRGNGGFICSQCHPDGGDFVELAMQYFGYSFIDVVNHVKTLFGVERMEQQKSTVELEREQHRIFLDDVRNLTQTLTESCPPVLYLNKRGIRAIPNTIRFLPQYKQDGKYYPCLIARLDDKNGNRVSYKIIHLNDDGTKANVPIVKKTLPCEREMDGCAVRLFKHSGVLAVSEGIETALAYSQDNNIPCWAVDNAQNMKKFEPPHDVKEFIIVADMDDSFTGQAAAYELARRCVNLIGKEGYALEKVNVILTIKRRGEFEIITDSGNKIDYLDFAGGA